MAEREQEDKIIQKLDELSQNIKGISIAEYIEMVRSPRRMILINFIAGLARGFGFAVGATFLGAVFLLLLFRLGQLNLPLIGKYIARIIKIVQTYL